MSFWKKKIKMEFFARFKNNDNEESQCLPFLVQPIEKYTKGEYNLFVVNEDHNYTDEYKALEKGASNIFYLSWQQILTMRGNRRVLALPFLGEVNIIYSFDEPWQKETINIFQRMIDKWTEKQRIKSREAILQQIESENQKTCNLLEILDKQFSACCCARGYKMLKKKFESQGILNGIQFIELDCNCKECRMVQNVSTTDQLGGSYQPSKCDTWQEIKYKH